MARELAEFTAVMAAGPSAYEKACEISPEAFFGVAEQSVKRGERGLAFEQFALVVKHAKRPITRAHALNNIGILQGWNHRHKEAFQAFDEAHQLDRKSAAVALNLAIAYRWQGDLEKAAKYLDEAGRLDPRQYETKMMTAEVKMLRGNYREGLSEYECRWTQPNAPARYNLAPQWMGGPIKGKSIFLYSEQGLGDMLMMLRYLPLLKERDAEVLIELPQAFERLMQPWLGTICNVPVNRSVDYELPIMSLPLRFQTRLDTIPKAPYFPCPSVKYDGVKDTVGLVWAGSGSNPIDYARSFGFDALRGLLDLECPFVSLQLGPKQFDCLGSRVLSLADKINDLQDTAEILASLKCIVTCDTSIVHLAGAIGTKALVAVSKYTDWRYGPESCGRKSPWYGDNVEIFRQKEPGDWSHPMAEIKQRLLEL